MDSDSYVDDDDAADGDDDKEKLCGGFADDDESQVDDWQLLFLFQKSNRSSCFLLI